ncbi:MAG: 2-iminoacetate synthase ThiH [Planctomycetota bacterium]
MNAGKQGIEGILAEKKLDKDSQRWKRVLDGQRAADVEAALEEAPGSYRFEKLAALVSPAGEEYLEQTAQAAQELTVRRFGRTIQLYAPLYLSNYCVNNCVYCGYNSSSSSSRIRLTIEQALADADIIAREGFRHLLLVSGEDRDFITVEYLRELAGRLREKFCSISMEIYAMKESEYAEVFAAGIEGVTLYQETYDRGVYSRYHRAGPKSDYDNRLTVHDRTASAGMRRLGVGVLLGLGEWRSETLALAEHANYLMKRYWKSQVSFSFPRLRPASNVIYHFDNPVSDKNLVQMILALRLCFADAPLVLSTRERAELRDRLVCLGITSISAGSKTNPGGYSGENETLEQFQIDDRRTAGQVAQMLRSKGVEAVWKDWDSAFTG